ncbi:MAG TPA: FHA domain-containing protein, partial [Gemmatales bacterium]|nr:FHA domain-containing protein [Gemmatales bacterium]
MARWRIRLRGVSPQLEGKHWESDQQLRVGRFENLEIVLNDPSISRKHAEIVASEQGWVLRDLGSTNGTFLNGIRVGRSDRRLRQRDVVQFGNLVLVVQVLEEDAVASHDSDPPSGTMQVQATTSQSWEKALESIAFKGEQRRPRAEDRLLTLLRASQHLVNIASLEMLLRSILDDAVRALDAQRAAIILFDEKRKELVLRSVSTGEREGGGRIYYSRSLAQRCFTKSESLLCKDVATSPELLVANSIADGAMASIICAVLRSPRRRLGVLHLDRGPLQEAFNQEDLSLADALAASVSAGIESAQLMEKQRELFLQTVTALAQAVELRDRYTGGHTQRVTDYAIILADALN